MNINFPTSDHIRRWVSLPVFLIIVGCVLVLSCTDEDIPTYSSPQVGFEWEFRASGLARQLTGIAWSGKVFVTVGDNSIFSSVDARTWQLRVDSTPGGMHAVCWSGKEFIAVGAGCILVSEDGISWEVRTVGEVLNGVAASDTLAVAVGNGGVVLTSHDLVTWHKEIYTDSNLAAITWDPEFVYAEPDSRGTFVLCGNGVVARYRQTDGVSQFRRLAYGEGWNGVAEVRSVVVVTRASSCLGVMGYPTSTGFCLGSKYRAIAGYGDGFVAVGRAGWTTTLVLTGEEPHTLLLRAYRHKTPVDVNLNAITAAGNGCVAVGDYGVVVASPPSRTE